MSEKLKPILSHTLEGSSLLRPLMDSLADALNEIQTEASKNLQEELGLDHLAIDNTTMVATTSHRIVFEQWLQSPESRILVIPTNNFDDQKQGSINYNSLKKLHRRITNQETSSPLKQLDLILYGELNSEKLKIINSHNRVHNIEPTSYDSAFETAENLLKSEHSTIIWREVLELAS